MRDLIFDIKGRDKTRPAFDQAKGNARGFIGHLDRMGASMRGLEAQAKAFAAGFAITGVVGFVREMRNAVAEAGHLVDVSEKIGVSLNDLQAINFGFSQAGVEADQVEQALTQWSKRIGEAYTQGGQLADVLKANGVSLTDQNGKLRGSVDLLHDMADLIANSRSEQEQTALAMEAFGRSGADLVPVLRGGADELDRIMQAAKDARVIIDTDLLQRGDKIDDKWDKIGRTIDTKVNTTLLVAAELVDRMIDGVDTLAASWAKFTGAADGSWIKHLLMTPGAALAPGAIVSNALSGLFNSGDQSLPDDPRVQDWYKKREPTDAGTIRHGFGDDSGARQRSAGAARQQRDAYAEVIKALQQENELIGLGEVDQRILTEQRRAGVAAASAQGQAIADLVRKNAEEQASVDALIDKQRELEEAMRDYADMAMDFASTLADGFLEGKDAADAFADSLKALGRDLLQSGLRQGIDLLFKSLLGGGGLFGGIGSGGGNLTIPWSPDANGAGTPYVPAALASSAAGRAEAPSAAEGGPQGFSFNYAPVYNVSGSGPEIDGLKRLMAKDRAEFSRRVVETVLDARRRNMKV